MKKALFSATLLATTALLLNLTACKKKDDSTNNTTPTPSYACASCTTTPDAKAANDNISKGIYKGVIVGSSGTIKFDIMNGDTTIKAYMTIDGTSVTLTANVKWVSGSSYVSPFTGTMNGQTVTINFSVGADGSNPSVTSMDIPGHPNATLSIAKETSSNLIKCFEGTATNKTTGENVTFDLFLSTSLKKWSATVQDKSGNGKVDGTFDGTTLSFDDGKGATGSATLSGDNIINGTWKNTKPENGTWEAKRTL